MEILNRYTKAVLYKADTEDIREALGLAMKGESNLSWADLSGADLSGTNLSGADLSEADLSGTNLSGANLSWADLRGANLSGADLSWADLSWADLSGADLSEADLSEADLRGADLGEANLSWADLRGADLGGADLGGADLSGADLSEADLRGADLRGADLGGADLSGIKKDFIDAILLLPEEIPFLRQALVDGKIDGSTYTGECACLAGTLAHACGLDFESFKKRGSFPVSMSSPRERWFLAIKPGDTPEKSPFAAITLEWIDEALAILPA